jgi:hypothetical protein
MFSFQQAGRIQRAAWIGFLALAATLVPATPGRATGKTQGLPKRVAKDKRRRAGRVSIFRGLQPALARVAKDIKQLLDEHDKSAVAVGQFTGPPTFPTGGGPGVARVLADELKKQGVAVKERASVGVEGSFRWVHAKGDQDENEPEATTVEFTLKVVDDGGKSLLKEDRRFKIFDQKDIAILLGLTTHTPPETPRRGRGQEVSVTAAIEDPRFFLAGSRVQASRTSPYAVEIAVAPSARGPFRARRPKNRDGLAYVRIRKGEVYRVRVINRSRYKAAVTLSIDGISIFSFCKERTKEGDPKYSKLIVPPGVSEIKGWFIDLRNSESFVATEYAKSAAAELKSTAKTGMITVTFAAAWDPNGKPPPDEPRHEEEKNQDSDDEATGRGQRVPDRYREGHHEVGVLRDTISIRYTKK